MPPALTLAHPAEECSAVNAPPFVLASRSPRRRQLLEEAGYRFSVSAADVDEEPLAGEHSAALALRLAVAKAEAVAGGVSRGTVVLAADTTVACTNRLLGKPRDAADARAMLRLLSGRNHRVTTAWAVRVAGAPPGSAIIGVSVSIVRMRELAHAEIAAYAQTEEPYDKAGGYAVQGAGNRFIAAVLGPLDTVIGLPVAAVAETLARFGVRPVRAQ